MIKEGIVYDKIVLSQRKCGNYAKVKQYKMRDLHRRRKNQELFCFLIPKLRCF